MKTYQTEHVIWGFDFFDGSYKLHRESSRVIFNRIMNLVIDSLIRIPNKTMCMNCVVGSLICRRRDYSLARHIAASVEFSHTRYLECLRHSTSRNERYALAKKAPYLESRFVERFLQSSISTGERG